MRMGIALALAALSCVAHAQWVEVARNADLVLFQDPSTDRAQGGIVQTRELQHYLTESTFFGMKVGSRVFERQYDCGALKRRAIRADMFEAGMAQGKPFDGSGMPDAPWTPVAAEPLGEAGLAAACKRVTSK